MCWIAGIFVCEKFTHDARISVIFCACRQTTHYVKQKQQKKLQHFDLKKKMNVSMAFLPEGFPIQSHLILQTQVQEQLTCISIVIHQSSRSTLSMQTYPLSKTVIIWFA